ncbi:MAG: ZIP family metal transporter [Planctomycetales bacterium]|nr:ZIP family metal transporter [Planctomycetales bacterium]
MGVIILYSLAVVLASVFGGLLPEWIRLTHNRMQLLISFVGGMMLGIAVFHMLPHALAMLGLQAINQIVLSMMLGLLATFFLLQFFHFHQHGPADFGIEASPDEKLSHDTETLTQLCSDHVHPCDGRLHHEHNSTSNTHIARWVLVLIGLGLHTMLDGVALAAGVAAEVGPDENSWLPGLGIFLAVLLHKPLDAVSITSLMHPIASAHRRLLVNIGFALMCPLGAVMFWLGTHASASWSTSLAGWGLAFSCGVFMCIALSDLLPEMEFHSHNKLPLSGALMMGIVAAWSIGYLEGEHAHVHHDRNGGDAGVQWIEEQNHNHDHDH